MLGWPTVTTPELEQADQAAGGVVDVFDQPKRLDRVDIGVAGKYLVGMHLDLGEMQVTDLKFRTPRLVGLKVDGDAGPIAWQGDHTKVVAIAVASNRRGDITHISDRGHRPPPLGAVHREVAGVVGSERGVDVSRARAFVLAHTEGDYRMVRRRWKQSANRSLVAGHRSKRTPIRVQRHPHQTSEVRGAIGALLWLRSMLAKEGRHIGIAVWQHLGQRCEQGIKDLDWCHLSSLSATTAVTPTSDGVMASVIT